VKKAVGLAELANLKIFLLADCFFSFFPKGEVLSSILYVRILLKIANFILHYQFCIFFG